MIDPDSPDYELMKSVTELWVELKLGAWDPAVQTTDLGPFAETAVCPFHLAIGFMALDDHRRAIEFLDADLTRGHPAMVWLHLWPIFDPLRKHPEFNCLMQKMKVPK